MACWYVRTPPFARTRPWQAFLCRSFRVISVRAYTSESGELIDKETLASGGKTYMHGVVIAGTSEGCQSP